jgi:calcineurin-binding protein cabin-1
MQVDLLVALHDLLAEYGLCCAGGDGEGEEGTCLKFAIKHLMALDVKLKSQLSMFFFAKLSWYDMFLWQLITSICRPSLSSYIDPSGMEGSHPENGRTQDTVTDEHSAGDDKHNSEDEEESGRLGLP